MFLDRMRSGSTKIYWKRDRRAVPLEKYVMAGDGPKQSGKEMGPSDGDGQDAPLKKNSAPKSTETKFGTAADENLDRIIAGRYRVLDSIGKGGMGSVYHVEHANTGKQLAVKLLKSQFSKDLKLIARFRREAMAASRLNHENCVAVYDFGQEEEGSFFIVMEYIEGRKLKSSEYMATAIF